MAAPFKKQPSPVISRILLVEGTPRIVRSDGFVEFLCRVDHRLDRAANNSANPANENGPDDCPLSTLGCWIDSRMADIESRVTDLLASAGASP